MIDRYSADSVPAYGRFPGWEFQDDGPLRPRGAFSLILIVRRNEYGSAIGDDSTHGFRDVLRELLAIGHIVLKECVSLAHGRCASALCGWAVIT